MDEGVNFCRIDNIIRIILRDFQALLKTNIKIFDFSKK